MRIFQIGQQKSTSLADMNPVYSSNSELSRLSNWETEKFLYFYFQLVVHKRQEVISLMGHQLYANYSNKKASLHTFHKLPNKVGINGHIQEPLLYI